MGWGPVGVLIEGGTETGSLLPAACCLLLAACCLLFAACCLLLATCYLVLAACCLLTGSELQQLLGAAQACVLPAS